MINAVVVEGMSCRAAAARFGVSGSSAIKWVERVERRSAHGRKNGRLQTGEVGAAPRLPRRLVGGENPTSRCRRCAIGFSSERGVKADTSLMSRFLRRLGVTLKKRPSSRASRTAQT